MMTLAQAVREAYVVMGGELTWQVWHDMAHQTRVEFAAFVVGSEKAQELR